MRRVGVHDAQQLCPAPDRPRLVVGATPLPAAPPSAHAAVVARLHQDQRLPAPAPCGEPGVAPQAFCDRELQPRQEAPRRYRIVLRVECGRCARAEGEHPVNGVQPALLDAALHEHAALRRDTGEAQHPPDAGQLPRMVLADVDRSGGAAAQLPRQRRPLRTRDEGEVPPEGPDSRSITAAGVHQRRPVTDTGDVAWQAIAPVQQGGQCGRHDGVAQAGETEERGSQRRDGHGGTARPPAGLADRLSAARAEQPTYRAGAVAASP